MKKASDPRHKRRRELVKSLFASSFTPQAFSPPGFIQILTGRAKIDKIIQAAAPEWPIEKINRIDLAILRLAVYELSKKETPPKVVIDEAVEIAKEYGGDSSPSFVNGVLGTAYEKLK